MDSPAEGTAPGPPDWGAPARRQPLRRLWILLLMYAPGVVLGVIVAALGNETRGVLATVIYVIGATMLLFGQGARVASWLGARKLRVGEEPRLVNLVHAIAREIGVHPPQLWVIDDPSHNAAAFSLRGPAIAVTKGLLTDYTRTELEAVAAHSLVRFARGDVATAMLASGAWPLGDRLAPPVGYDDDVQAAAVTRFPPALAAAIEKADPRSGRYAGLWFVATGSTHRAPVQRIGELRSL